MDNRKENKTKVEDFMTYFTEEEVKSLDKAVSALTKVFKSVIPIGDKTIQRLITSMVSDNEEDKKYYEEILQLCNNCMAILFLIDGVSIDD